MVIALTFKTGLGLVPGDRDLQRLGDIVLEVALLPRGSVDLFHHRLQGSVLDLLGLKDLGTLQLDQSSLKLHLRPLLRGLLVVAAASLQALAKIRHGHAGESHGTAGSSRLPELQGYDTYSAKPEAWWR